MQCLAYAVDGAVRLELVLLQKHRQLSGFPLHLIIVLYGAPVAPALEPRNLAEMHCKGVSDTASSPNVTLPSQPLRCSVAQGTKHAAGTCRRYFQMTYVN